jgi:hypothetical protein
MFRHRVPVDEPPECLGRVPRVPIENVRTSYNYERHLAGW